VKGVVGIEGRYRQALCWWRAWSAKMKLLELSGKWKQMEKGISCEQIEGMSAPS
jgi:hypothetical protein